MMHVALCYNSDTGRVDTDIEVSGKNYGPDQLDDMCARATKMHLQVMEKAATLWVAAVDGEMAEDVVTEDVQP
jgi:hypothetical protein